VELYQSPYNICALAAQQVIAWAKRLGDRLTIMMITRIALGVLALLALAVLVALPLAIGKPDESRDWFPLFLYAVVALVIAAISLSWQVLDRVDRLSHSEARNRDLSNTHRETVRALVCVMRARDDDTSAHCQRIEGWAESLARDLGLAEEEVKAVRLAALLHDVGKIGIPDSILLKPGPLTEAEWQVMRAHPAIGETILASAGNMGAVIPLVGSHHERWDGSGYPRGLAGEQIPLGARIIAVVDAYSAMTDHRAYRAARSHHEAMQELRQEAGRLFDPAVVALFDDLMRQEGAPENQAA
jgi:putative nucleotidyltransferase with HDIG domain